jgi:hypothetical protein
MQEGLWTVIVGNGNVNEGMARLIGLIALFIVVFGTLFWWISP